MLKSPITPGLSNLNGDKYCYEKDWVLDSPNGFYLDRFLEKDCLGCLLCIGDLCLLDFWILSLLDWTIWFFLFFNCDIEMAIFADSRISIWSSLLKFECKRDLIVESLSSAAILVLARGALLSKRGTTMLRAEDLILLTWIESWISDCPFGF